MVRMARAPTTSDAFNAIAEPQRREILELLKHGERPVLELAEQLGITQPSASKHLRVLREVRLVRVREVGKQRLYGLDARGLRPIHDWVGGFAEYWSESFDRLDAYVQELNETTRRSRHMAAEASRSDTDREIVISRTIHAPRDLVFEAFTDVRHLSQWWGPTGFTTTTRSFEFREGGSWNFVMHGPDGTDYPNWITWREIVRPERITLLHGDSADDQNAFESILTFEARGERTDLVMRTIFPTAELRDRAVREYHAI